MRGCELVEEEELRLLRRYRRDRDPAVRDALIRRFLPLAHRLARRYERGGEPDDDLRQVAAIGLLKAIERFDPERGAPFARFAVPTIVGELKRHLRDHGWSVRVPRQLKELAIAIDRTAPALAAELGRSPSTNELAASLATPLHCVLEAIEAGRAAFAVSLDRPADGGGDDAPAAAPIAALRTEDPDLERAEQRATLDRVLRRLSPRDRELLRLRYADDLTQSEIGRRMGVSQVQVSRLMRAALLRAREASG